MQQAQQSTGGMQTTLNIDYRGSLHQNSAEYPSTPVWKQRATLELLWNEKKRTASRYPSAFWINGSHSKGTPEKGLQKNLNPQWKKKKLKNR